MQVAIDAIKELTTEAGKPKWDWQAPEADSSLTEKVESAVKSELGEAYRVTDKMQRQDKVGALRRGVVDALSGSDDAQYSKDDVSDAFYKIEKNLVRQLPGILLVSIGIVFVLLG